jgi:broad-specificity NMP kinase
LGDSALLLPRDPNPQHSPTTAKLCRNYLIEGLSGTGKTSVCNELQRRGYHAIHGDRELAYRGDPETGEPTEGFAHEHHIWHVGKVRALVANQDETVTFFCGGSRNSSKFIDIFDGVFVLEVDPCRIESAA